MVALARLDNPVRIAEGLKGDLGLSDDELAAALGISPVFLQRWRSGIASPGSIDLRRLEHLAAVSTHLHETFKSPAGARWLRSESRYLGGQRPLDALLGGKFDRVEAALEALDSGIFV